MISQAILSVVEFAHQLSVFRPVDCVDTYSLWFVISASRSAMAVTGVLSVSDGREWRRGKWQQQPHCWQLGKRWDRRQDFGLRDVWFFSFATPSRAAHLAAAVLPGSCLLHSWGLPLDLLSSTLNIFLISVGSSTAELYFIAHQS